MAPAGSRSSFGASRYGAWISSSAPGTPASSSRARSVSAFSSAPNSTARLVIHIQTRNTITPPSVAVGLVVGAEVARRRTRTPPRRRSTSTHRHDAARARPSGSRAASRSAPTSRGSPASTSRSTSSTGHLAMFQTVTAVSPSPTALPIASATGPETISAEHDERRHQHEHERHEQLQRPQLPERPALLALVDRVRGAHEGADVARRRPQRARRGRRSGRAAPLTEFAVISSIGPLNVSTRRRRAELRDRCR